VNDFRTWYYQQPPALRTIITINVAVWVAMQFLHLWSTGLAFVQAHLALHPVFPDILLEPWQLVTYSFMHTGLLHIGVNMLLLFWVGREFEQMHGSQQFWTVYLTTAVGGALICLLLSPIAPSISGGVVNGRSIPVLGASASVLGVLTVVVGFLAIDSLLALRPGGNTAVAAHWGGALTGFLYAKSQQGKLGILSGMGALFGGGSSRRSTARRPTLLERLKGLFGRSSREDASAPRSRPHSSTDSASPPERDNGSAEVDRILDKISEKGYDSLSDEEKRTLYEASES
jgi:membrane associated rhomboid family serine protease